MSLKGKFINKNRAIEKMMTSVLLPDQDSNPNIQSQNLTYYHYTIGQSPAKIKKYKKMKLPSALFTAGNYFYFNLYTSLPASKKQPRP